MQSRRVYIDESGDENLNISTGASKFYVLAAIVVAESHANEFLLALEDLRKRYFQTGEMKSSKVGANLDRRLKILAFARTRLPPFAVVAYRVRKELVGSQSGLKFPKTFIKYFAKDFCRYLPASGVTDVRFDEKGRQNFKVEFVRYLEQRFKEDELFPKKQFSVVSSACCVGVQLADLYAGSIAKLIESQDDSERARLFAEISPICCTWDWPKPRMWGEGKGLSSDERLDNLVRAEALMRATRYVDSEGDGSEDSLLRAEFLKALIEHGTTADNEFMLAKELEDWLSRFVEKPISAQTLRNRVVGPLRDSGVLISSKSSRPDPGYKLPASVHDIESYIELTDAQVVPALRRVKAASQIVATATGGDVELLAQDRFDCLNKLTKLV